MAIEKTLTLVPGTELVGRYKRTQFTATVREDGIYVEPAPLTPATAADPHGPFKSLSAAAKAVMGGISANGWRFWSLAPVELAVVATDGDPKRRRPRGLRIVRRLPNQRGVPEGQVRWFCSACMAAFLSPAGPDVVTCPQGHPHEAADELSRST